MVRHLLTCGFVEKIIVSLNNPLTDLSSRLKMRDSRLVVVRQPHRRGSGVGWYLACAETAEYFMLMDDDVLLYPGQVASLFAFRTAFAGSKVHTESKTRRAR